ncbi:hypothetical protein BRADI_3g09441v3 [Brachypodium distachyon]|uniref:Uncharacterized protein n=1 Tax=Brachypodium distachyon TaxID=15368 RepID=A0A0Q3F3U8_BRADI|nr:hypothetical protein BRADI_3g09441v3 [Brachypodium distachyon]
MPHLSIFPLPPVLPKPPKFQTQRRDPKFSICLPFRSITNTSATSLPRSKAASYLFPLISSHQTTASPRLQALAHKDGNSCLPQQLQQGEGAAAARRRRQEPQDEEGRCVRHEGQESGSPTRHHQPLPAFGRERVSRRAAEAARGAGTGAGAGGRAEWCPGRGCCAGEEALAQEGVQIARAWRSFFSFLF